MKKLFRLGKLKGVARLFKRAPTSGPQDENDAVQEATLATKNQQWSEAADLWEKIRKRDPHAPPAAYGQGATALIQLRRFEDAKAVITRGLDLFPNVDALFVVHANLAKARGQWDLAAKRWARLRERNPDLPVAVNMGAEALAKIGRFEDAAGLLLERLSGPGYKDGQTYRLGAALLTRQMDGPVDHPPFSHLLRALFLQPVDTYRPTCGTEIGGEVLFLKRQAPAKFREKIGGIRAVWNEMRTQGEPCRLGGLQLGFVNDGPSLTEIDELTDQLYPTGLAKYLSSLPMHRANVHRTLEECRAHLASAEGTVLNKDQTLKLAIILAGHDFGLARQLLGFEETSSREITRDDTLSSPSISRNRLSIAVCVSGQLRGYADAFRTWKNFELDGHDVHYFVHTWRNIGRRRPANAVQAARVFSGNMLAAYKEAIVARPLAELEKTLPNLFRLIDESQSIESDTLKETYGTDHVEIEDETDKRFSKFSNPMKMYYKVQKCWELCKSSGREFDLYMRIRPDREILPDTDIDWNRIYERTRTENILFAEKAFDTFETSELIVGDQLAVANARIMDAYSRTFDRTSRQEGLFNRWNYEVFAPHRNFGLALLENGIAAELLPGLRYGEFLELSQLDSASIIGALERDVEATGGPVARPLLEAARKDAQADLS